MSAATSDGRRWFWYRGDSGPFGPNDTAFMLQLSASGAITSETLVWNEELGTEWRRWQDVAPSTIDVPSTLPPLTGPTEADLDVQQDNFWREGLLARNRSPAEAQIMYEQFIGSISAQIRHLPQNEQDRLTLRIVQRNAEYIQLGQRDRNALMVRLGLSPDNRASGHVANAVVDTAVRATTWHAVNAFFRLFR